VAVTLTARRLYNLLDGVFLSAYSAEKSYTGFRPASTLGIIHANRLESDEKGTSGDFESLQASVTPDRGHQQDCSGD